MGVINQIPLRTNSDVPKQYMFIFGEYHYGLVTQRSSYRYSGEYFVATYLQLAYNDVDTGPNAGINSLFPSGGFAI